MEHGDTVDTSGLSRALAAFHNRNVGVTDILAVAGSGLCLAATTRRQQDEVDRLAANLFMLDALTAAAATYLGGHTVLNTAVRNPDGYLVTMKANERLLLAVLADPSCDIGQVVHELCQLCDYLAPVSPSDAGR